MLNFIYTKETSDINTICHYYTDDDGSIKGICVQKDISQEQALLILESLPNENEQEFPEGLS